MAGENTKRTRHDWDAVERDYRTGKLTLKELEAKHGPGYADISRRAKKYEWSQDLRVAVKQATNAALIAETTKAVTNEAQTQTTNVVLAAAELNKQVILGDRSRIKGASELAMDMLHELRLTTHSGDELAALFKQVSEGMDEDAVEALQQSVQDMLRLHNRVGSLHKLIDTLTKLQAMERKAFGLDDADLDESLDKALPPPNESARRIAYALRRGIAANDAATPVPARQAHS